MSANPFTQITERLGNLIVLSSEFRGETTFVTEADKLFETLKILKEELGFLYLVDVTAVDYLGIKSPRFEMIYQLHRFGADYDENLRLRVKTALPEENAEVDSVTPIWKGADWLEREVYDMFGVKFKGHPDLRRILMPEDYEEHPLRKDFDVRDREPSKRSFQKAMKEGNF